ncbi:transcriptional regulator GcvA [Pseudophaeobacter sp.]|uniref:transcriptional regulator GcvA n=1 Tax=Pseudophaeobacter sp. TaxID=1971739 RepID=UPI003297B238
MKQLPPLNALKAFESAGRHLNFRLAAQELGVSQGAVAQQVRALEARLQIQLFHRQPRGVSLTDEGRKYLTPVRRAFEMITKATEALKPQNSVVTISSTPSFATKWLVPRLGQLSSDFPQLRVRLDASNTLANFQNDGVDIAIRQGEPPFGPGLIAQPLLSSKVIAVCHPSLTLGERALRKPVDIVQHVLLQDAHGFWPLMLEQIFSDHEIPEMRVVNFSQTALAIDAAIDGQGVALTNRAFVEKELRQGSLCQPFDLTVENNLGYFVVAPRRPRNAEVVQMLRDWIQNQV